MYEQFFHLSGPPFRLAPDPRFFFGSKSHNKAMSYLHYGLRQAEGFIVITGEIGAGKSILIGHLIDQLDRTNVIAAHLLTPNIEPDALLSHILSAFRVEPAGAGKTAELEAFEDFLFDQMNRGRRVLLIADEAQNFPPQTLEELRVLSNMEYEGTPLFQVFLVGQPDFREALAAEGAEQLRQRVIASYHLEPLTRDETEDYVLHRLSVAGWTQDPKFDRAAFDAIYAATAGVPRKINKVCTRILLLCAIEEKRSITKSVVASVLKDLETESFSSRDREVVLEPELHEEAEAAAPIAPAAAEDQSEGIAALAGQLTPEKIIAESPPPPAASAPEPEESLMVDIPNTTNDAPAAGDSVFDRLNQTRASRGPRPPRKKAKAAEKLDGEPSAATLDEVADAIKAVGAERPEDAEGIAANGAEPKRLDDEERAWKRTFVASINETRDELKLAHQGVSQLRRQIKDVERRRRERRGRIVASLSRAESLLTEIRNAWR